VKGNPYETDRYLNEYLLFHYGQPKDLCPFQVVSREALRFHARIREECLLRIGFTGHTRGLDVGCGVGRFAFELGQVVEQVLGIDNSRRFITAARRMASHKAMSVQIKESGAQFTMRRVVLPKALQRGHVEFRVGDVHSLSALRAQPFHVVAAINLLCRLPHPRQFLTGLHRLVVPGGQLVMASPFSWLEAHTSRSEWLAGAEVVDLLRPHFRLARQRDLTFVIREHRRKYQLVVSQVMVFLRRES
jgi:2-polyprenyl-3-methyl-5-hydroxy-6-metoxy-1,4-benzoquinol methylase